MLNYKQIWRGIKPTRWLIKFNLTLAIQNNNHTQEHKIYVETPFFLKGKKTTGQTPNNFSIIKSITIILMYVSWLKKNPSYFSLLLHTHTHYLFQRQQYFTLSSSAIFSKAATLRSLFLDYLLKGSNTLHSPSSCVPPKRKIFVRLFVALSIYKTLLLFPLGLGIHYLFNKESIPSWIRNTLPH